MNPYTFLFYILYKFIKLTTKEEHQEQVPRSASSLYLICLTNNFAAIIIFTKAVKYFSLNLIFQILEFAIVPIIIYFLNKLLFIDNESYLDIEARYDNKNLLKKEHFIIIAVFYIVISVGFLIWSGVNYNK
ncbi:MAG: hypothetical protein RIT22_849 [Bacteroidota bacterium]|jgi:hypothetical protein